ncbi:hypothetical protein RHS01_09205 [Rhizoctonia solani]|uniref:Uncharacterized protein n=1 Tax=Rhizoctonia solani TaxID=456999 RepID=A0A8H7M151_9AGAM|nr:hypothetical protein RHS01_09205 [Rhizoctonia solani]
MQRRRNSDDEYDEDKDELVFRLLLSGNNLVVPRSFHDGSKHAQQIRAPKKRKRHYLRRTELQQAPTDNSGWQSLYESCKDRAYIRVLGIDVATFKYLIETLVLDDNNMTI